MMVSHHVVVHRQCNLGVYYEEEARLVDNAWCTLHVCLLMFTFGLKSNETRLFSHTFPFNHSFLTIIPSFHFHSLSIIHSVLTKRSTVKTVKTLNGLSERKESVSKLSLRGEIAVQF